MEKQYLKPNSGDYEQSIQLLNFDAKELYKNGRSSLPISNKYRLTIKSNLLSMIIDIERVIKGTFGCDIFMKEAKYETLKQMFPHGLEIFDVKSQEDIIKVGRFFDTLRNASAHAYISDTDFSIFDRNFSNLRNEKKYLQDIHYEQNGKLTIAGLLFVIMNFLRSESIYKITKRDSLFALISCGEKRRDENSSFVKDISKVNLEIDIREKTGDSIVESVLGQYVDKLNSDGTFDFYLGVENNPTFKASGYIFKNEIKINPGSLTKTFYKEPYLLKIKYREGFVSLSNQLPELAFVDLLYTLGIKKYDESAHEKVMQNFERLYLKLNHPKFYIDKNIKILTLPNTISDFRPVSEVVTDSIINIFMQLEYDLKRDTNTKLDGGYSSINKLLRKYDAPSKLYRTTTTLRNFAMHGYVFDEYIILEGFIYQYTLDFVIDVLKDLITFFERADDIKANLENKILFNFINKLINFKYRQLVEKSLEFMIKYPVEKDSQITKDLAAKNLFVDRSMYKCEILSELNDLCEGKCIVKTYYLKELDCKIAFFCNDYNSEKTNEFILNHFEIISGEDKSVVQELVCRSK